MSDLERLMSKLIEQEDGCWIFNGCRSSFGHGRIYYMGDTEFAHRLSWILHKGSIPADMCVLHTCDVPACCNPDHLFLGTRVDNAVDMYSKGRASSRVGSNHNNSLLIEEEVREIIILLSQGKLTKQEIGDKYRVSRSTINLINRGVTWTHVDRSIP